MPLFVVIIPFEFRTRDLHFTVVATTCKDAASASLARIAKLGVLAIRAFEPWGNNSVLVSLPGELREEYYNARFPHIDVSGEFPEVGAVMHVNCANAYLSEVRLVRDLSV